MSELTLAESSETPKLNAFCLVAPSVRFRDRAIFLAGIFCRARVFSSRTSSFVHSRRLDRFFAMVAPILKMQHLVTRKIAAVEHIFVNNNCECYRSRPSRGMLMRSRPSANSGEI